VRIYVSTAQPSLQWSQGLLFDAAWCCVFT